MQYKIDHDYHIHSMLSRCSRDPEQSNERILKYAKDNGLGRICLTDHYWDSSVEGASKWYVPQDFDHISQALPLPQAEGVEFLFGCESDMDKYNVLGVPASRFDDFDFMIIPTTHLHMRNFTIDEADMSNQEKRAAIWVDRLDALLEKDLPFGKIGIAHLACELISKISRADFLETIAKIPSDEMERLFAKAASLGCGIELNRSDMQYAEEEEDCVLRIFRIAKYQGCKFYLGSDSHHPNTLDSSIPFFERAIKRLGLTENDKFYIG